MGMASDEIKNDTLWMWGLKNGLGIFGKYIAICVTIKRRRKNVKLLGFVSKL